MSPSHLSRLERGVYKYTQQTLEQLAEALNVSKADLLSVNPYLRDARDEWAELGNKLRTDQVKPAINMIEHVFLKLGNG